jgi:hypothetical protein
VGAPPYCFGKAARSRGGKTCLCFAPMVVAKAPPPKPGVALPQCKGGKDLTTAEPLEGEGGTTGCGDAGGAYVPPPNQLKALCAVSPYTTSTRVEGEENGGTAVTRHSGLFPKV